MIRDLCRVHRSPHCGMYCGWCRVCCERRWRCILGGGGWIFRYSKRVPPTRPPAAAGRLTLKTLCSARGAELNRNITRFPRRSTAPRSSLCLAHSALTHSALPHSASRRAGTRWARRCWILWLQSTCQTTRMAISAAGSAAQRRAGSAPGLCEYGVRGCRQWLLLHCKGPQKLLQASPPPAGAYEDAGDDRR